MSQNTDLYPVLYYYAKKNESPIIDMNDFIPFLEKHAGRLCTEKPEWTRWLQETSAKVWKELNQLIEEGMAAVNSGETGSKIYLCHYYTDQIQEVYKNPDIKAGLPFRDVDSFDIAIPEEQIKKLYLSKGLMELLWEPQETLLPVIRLVFPRGHGGAAVLAPMIPLTLLEYAMSKLKNFLLNNSNKDYIQHKLTPQFGSREESLREGLEKILMRPKNCIDDIKSARESSYYFWGYFCNLVKADLNQKGELLAEETAALQAVYIIEVCCNFFKSKGERAKIAELAFRTFELEMEKPPFYFTREDIAQFKDGKDKFLLEMYTQEGLDAYIKKRTTEPVTPGELPDLLYFQGPGGTSWLIKKTKVLHLCAKLFADARPQVIGAVSRRWKKLLTDFRREPAMEDDKEFEKLVVYYVDACAPTLSALLQDYKLYLVHEEMRTSEKGIPDHSRLFIRDELLPLRTLLLLKRRQLISDVRLLLPFWYSLPLLSSIFAFFANLGKKKSPPRERDEAEEEKLPEDPYRELREKAKETEQGMIPAEYSREAYMEELISRWGGLAGKKEKASLAEDVNVLVRDTLRRILHTRKTIAVNDDTLDRMAGSIVDTSEGLRKIRDRKALLLYVKLYIIKLLTGTGW